jgi:hypothetical protein
MINLMCHMTLLSNLIELSMLTLDMLHKDLILYSFDDVLEFHHSISDFILIDLMCHLIEQSH